MTLSKQVGKPTAMEMMLGTIVVIQDFKEKAEKLKKEIKDFSDKFSVFKDAQNITAYSMYNNLVRASESFDLVTLNLEFSEGHATKLYNRLKEKEEKK